MQLSQSQEAAKQDFLKFLDDPNGREFTISGPAGSGKTFLLTYLLEAAYNEQKLLASLDDTESQLDIYLSATTHKAVEVLKESVPEYTAETVFSRLNLRVKNDFKTGTTSLVKNSYSGRNKNEFMTSLAYGNRTILVIDEASMVSRELYTHIKELISRTTNLRVVYVGDKYQLPPVMEACSPVFTRVKNISYLTEIQRQTDGSTIVPVAQQMRDVMDTAGPWPQIADSANIKVIKDPQKWLEMIAQAFAENDNPEVNRVLAWSNKHVTGYNQHILKSLGHNTMFYVDNVAINNSRIQISQDQALRTDEPVRIIDIDDTIYTHTIDLEPSKEMAKFSFEYRNLHVRSLQSHTHYHVKVPVSMADFNAKVKAIRKYISSNFQVSWQSYFRVKESFADLRPAFAQTLHKSQGSTYRNVFIDLQDVSRNNKWLEVAQLVYTGMTRASHNVFFYGELPEKWTKTRKECINEVFTHETASFT